MGIISILGIQGRSFQQFVRLVFTTAQLCLLLVVLIGCDRVNNELASPNLPDSTISDLSSTIETAARSAAAPPTFMVAIATSSGAELVRTFGSSHRAGSDNVNTVTDQFYIASVTKPYVGLLAARLHARRVLDLDSPLADWLPPVSGGTLFSNSITLRDLLSHQSGISNPTLTFRSGNLGVPAGEDFERLLLTYSSVESDGEFAYNNLGYLIYAWVLEKHTGKTWIEWLSSDVLAPLELEHTSVNPIGGHRRIQGSVFAQGEWHAVQNKHESTLHAAGGLYTSPVDAAKWIADMLRQSSLEKRVYEDHKAKQASTTLSILDAQCDGYGLGLVLCDYGGFDVKVHFGQRNGWRSLMSFSDSLDAGVFISATTSNEGEMWLAVLEQQLYKVLSGSSNAEEFSGRLAYIEQAFVSGAEGRQADRDAVVTRTIEESEQALKEFVGEYYSDQLGPIDLRLEGGSLVFSAGSYDARLVQLDSADSRTFGVFDDYISVPDILRFESNKLIWNEDEFDFVRRVY